MALETLAEAIVALKRTTGYGAVSVTDDAKTLDIIKAINDRSAEISRFWLWDWQSKDITITLTSATDYTLDADIASVEVLGASGQKPAQRITKKEYYKYYYGQNTSRAYYMYVGRNATTGARIIRVGGVLDSATSLTGFGKQRLAKFAVADIAAATDFLPMPDDMVGLLKQLVTANIKDWQGKAAEWPLVQKLAYNDLERATGQEQSDPGEEPKSPPPDSYRRKKSARRYGRTA